MEMETSERLQKVSFPIESSICSLDRERGYTLTDVEVIEIIELLADIYVYGDTKEKLSEKIDRLNCRGVVELVENELSRLVSDDIGKVLSAVRYVAQRRAQGGRHHMNVLQQYVGAFVRSDVGLRRQLDGSEMVVG